MVRPPPLLPTGLQRRLLPADASRRSTLPLASEQQPEPGSPGEAERAALQRALVRVLSKPGGYHAAGPGEIARAAGLSPETFYAHYRNAEECYLATYDAAINELRVAMAEGAEEARSAHGADAWRRQLDGAVGAMLTFLAKWPELARALFTEVHNAGPAAMLRREAMLARFVSDIDHARATLDNPAPALASGVLVRGLDQVISARIARGMTQQLPMMLDDLSHYWREPGTDD